MELTQVKGIAEKRAKELNKLGVFTAEDLVRYYPRTYLDMTNRVSVREVLNNDTALIAARITYIEPMRYTGRVRFLRAHLEQDGDMFTAVWFNMPYLAKTLNWFNMPYLAKTLKEGEYLFYGRVQNKYGQVSLVNPTFEPMAVNARLKGLVPVYPLRSPLTQRAVRTAVQAALRAVSPPSVIPAELVQRYGIASLAWAYRTIHAPMTEEERLKSSERIALEEYFTLVSAFKLIKGDKNEARSVRYSVTEADVAQFMRSFSFEFTKGQSAAVRAIYDDVKGPSRMNRLLQGDVGSGKTAVALTGIYMAVKSGHQAVYLSPTEVLAAQNELLLRKMFPEYRVGYLSGASTAQEKRAVKAALKAGEIDILCGTHALLQGDVHFCDLAFCVCDEQHRFGGAPMCSSCRQRPSRAPFRSSFTATSTLRPSPISREGGRRSRRRSSPYASMTICWSMCENR